MSDVQVNLLATVVCAIVTLHATGRRRYVMASIGAVITMANLWTAIFQS